MAEPWGRPSAQDWGSTRLGPAQAWPAALSTALSIVLNSPESMALVWGPDLTFFCNDACRSVLGTRLDGALGRPLPLAWPDAWGTVRGAVMRALAGEACRVVADPIPMGPHGVAEPPPVVVRLLSGP